MPEKLQERTAREIAQEKAECVAYGFEDVIRDPKKLNDLSKEALEEILAEGKHLRNANLEKISSLINQCGLSVENLSPNVFNKRKAESVVRLTKSKNGCTLVSFNKRFTSLNVLEKQWVLHKMAKTHLGRIFILENLNYFKKNYTLFRELITIVASIEYIKKLARDKILKSYSLANKPASILLLREQIRFYRKFGSLVKEFNKYALSNSRRSLNDISLGFKSEMLKASQYGENNAIAIIKKNVTEIARKNPQAIVDNFEIVIKNLDITEMQNICLYLIINKKTKKKTLTKICENFPSIFCKSPKIAKKAVGIIQKNFGKIHISIDTSQKKTLPDNWQKREKTTPSKQLADQIASVETGLMIREFKKLLNGKTTDSVWNIVAKNTILKASPEAHKKIDRSYHLTEGFLSQHQQERDEALLSKLRDFDSKFERATITQKRLQFQKIAEKSPINFLQVLLHGRCNYFRYYENIVGGPFMLQILVIAVTAYITKYGKNAPKGKISVLNTLFKLYPWCQHIPGAMQLFELVIPYTDWDEAEIDEKTRDGIASVEMRRIIEKFNDKFKSNKNIYRHNLGSTIDDNLILSDIALKEWDSIELNKRESLLENILNKEKISEIFLTEFENSSMTKKRHLLLIMARKNPQIVWKKIIKPNFEYFEQKVGGPFMLQTLAVLIGHSMTIVTHKISKKPRKTDLANEIFELYSKIQHIPGAIKLLEFVAAYINPKEFSFELLWNTNILTNPNQKIAFNILEKLATAIPLDIAKNYSEYKHIEGSHQILEKALAASGKSNLAKTFDLFHKYKKEKVYISENILIEATALCENWRGCKHALAGLSTSKQKQMLRKRIATILRKKIKVDAFYVIDKLNSYKEHVKAAEDIAREAFIEYIKVQYPANRNNSVPLGLIVLVSEQYSKFHRYEKELVDLALKSVQNQDLFYLSAFKLRKLESIDPRVKERFIQACREDLESAINTLSDHHSQFDTIFRILSEKYPNGIPKKYQKCFSVYVEHLSPYSNNENYVSYPNLNVALKNYHSYSHLSSKEKTAKEILMGIANKVPTALDIINNYPRIPDKNLPVNIQNVLKQAREKGLTYIDFDLKLPMSASFYIPKNSETRPPFENFLREKLGNSANKILAIIRKAGIDLEYSYSTGSEIELVKGRLSIDDKKIKLPLKIFFKALEIESNYIIDHFDADLSSETSDSPLMETLKTISPNISKRKFNKLIKLYLQNPNNIKIIETIAKENGRYILKNLENLYKIIGKQDFERLVEIVEIAIEKNPASTFDPEILPYILLLAEKAPFRIQELITGAGKKEQKRAFEAYPKYASGFLNSQGILKEITKYDPVGTYGAFKLKAVENSWKTAGLNDEYRVQKKEIESIIVKKEPFFFIAKNINYLKGDKALKAHFYRIKNEWISGLKPKTPSEYTEEKILISRCLHLRKFNKTSESFKDKNNYREIIVKTAKYISRIQAKRADLRLIKDRYVIVVLSEPNYIKKRENIKKAILAQKPKYYKAFVDGINDYGTETIARAFEIAEQDWLFLFGGHGTSSLSIGGRAGTLSMKKLGEILIRIGKKLEHKGIDPFDTLNCFMAQNACNITNDVRDKLSQILINAGIPPPVMSFPSEYDQSGLSFEDDNAIYGDFNLEHVVFKPNPKTGITTMESMRENEKRLNKKKSLPTQPTTYTPRAIREVGTGKIDGIKLKQRAKNALFVESPTKKGMFEFMPETKKELEQTLKKNKVRGEKTEIIRQLFSKAPRKIVMMQLF